MDVNVAAEDGTKLTASSSQNEFEPEKAVLISTTSTAKPYCCSKVNQPSWFCAEFFVPKIIARLVII